MAMRTIDVAGLALSALGRHKVRTALTVLGVTIGTFTLVASLSIGTGVDRAIIDLFRGTGALRQIIVSINYENVDASEMPEAERRVEGEMSETKRERIRRALIANWARRHGSSSRPRLPLDRAALADLQRLPHVERVLPYVAGNGWVYPLGADPEKRQEASISSITPDEGYIAHLVAGRAFLASDVRPVILHELLLYRWGVTSEAQVAAMIGQAIRIEVDPNHAPRLTLERLLSYGPEGFEPEEAQALVQMLHRLAPLVRIAPIPGAERAAFARLMERTSVEDVDAAPGSVRYQADYTLVGVVRSPGPDEAEPISPAGYWYRDSQVILPPSEAEAMSIDNADFAQAVLVADDQAHVKALTEAVEAAGFSQYSLVQMIATIRLNVTLITFAVAFVAVVALSVAALGITNTMVMTVLERTHEIGIMKALGAREGQIRGIFLVEGVCLGVAGGLLGLLAAWAASFPGDAVARSIMQAQTPRPIETSLFAFDSWLILGAPALATLVTTLAAVYPAHRAARVDPIASLRHE